MAVITLTTPAISPEEERGGAVASPRINDQRQPPPLPGSVEEMIAAARVVGYGPGVPDGPVATALGIERLIRARIGWEC